MSVADGASDPSPARPDLVSEARLPAARSRKSFRSERERWQAQYLRNLRVSDTLVVIGALAVADAVRIGLLGRSREVAWTGITGVDYALLGVVLAILWLTLLALVDSRSRRIIGRGSEEYRRVITATFLLFGVIAFLSLALRVDPARGYIAIALPLGLAGLLVNRRLWRAVARRRRAEGRYQTTLLVVGNPSAARDVAAKFVSEMELGYDVVGLCTPGGPAESPERVQVVSRAIPVVGTDTDIVAAVTATGADTVAISPTQHLTPTEIRRLIWDLEKLGVDLIVTAGLMDVADERISSRPVAGLAMLLVDKPRYDHANSWGKRLFDICFAAVALVAAAPVLILAALAVKVSSRGPVFYRAERVGAFGRPFAMLKFRSMYVGADAQFRELIDAAGGDALFFKLRKDPRVTTVGRLLRKLSIDELPQFINVLTGDMSVVGPRPQLFMQAESLDSLMRRRLLVRPGVTGLWQVSGRSDLPVELATRLDLSYVENWSMATDLVIIGRTIQVVLTGRGAY